MSNLKPYARVPRSGCLAVEDLPTLDDFFDLIRSQSPGPQLSSGITRVHVARTDGQLHREGRFVTVSAVVC